MNIHFIRPLWLFLLIPAIIYLIWVLYASRQHNPWRAICDAHLLPALLQQPARTSQLFFNVALFSFFTLAIVALAGPSWKKAIAPVYKEMTSIMLVLDLSPAMQESDLKPDRLTRAKFKIRDLISASSNAQMGLVVFSAEAFVATPLSQDAKTLNAMLDELHPHMMPTLGSDIGQGLTQASTLLTQTGIRHSNVILITASEPTSNSWAAAQAIRQAGNQLNILAMMERNAATEKSITALEQLAQMGGGTVYLFTPDAVDIEGILRRNQGIETIKDQNMETADRWEDAGVWFCLFLVPLVLVVLRQEASK